MANWSDLKSSVANVIRSNGNNGISGEMMQDVLLSIISNLGALPSFAGIATPETNPGTPDGNVFYLASQVGTYGNFANKLEAGEIAVFVWNGTSWNKGVLIDSATISNALKELSVTTAKLANGAVTTAKLADGSVTREKLAEEAVSVRNIEDEAVTAPKISDGAVTTLKVAEGAITMEKLAEEVHEAIAAGSGSGGGNTDSPTYIPVSYIKTYMLDDGIVTDEKLANGAVTEGKLAGGAVTLNKLSTSNRKMLLHDFYLGNDNIIYAYNSEDYTETEGVYNFQRVYNSVTLGMTIEEGAAPEGRTGEIVFLEDLGIFVFYTWFETSGITFNLGYKTFDNSDKYTDEASLFKNTITGDVYTLRSGTLIPFTKGRRVSVVSLEDIGTKAEYAVVTATGASSTAQTANRTATSALEIASTMYGDVEKAKTDSATALTQANSAAAKVDALALKKTVTSETITAMELITQTEYDSKSALGELSDTTAYLITE